MTLFLKAFLGAVNKYHGHLASPLHCQTKKKRVFSRKRPASFELRNSKGGQLTDMSKSAEMQTTYLLGAGFPSLSAQRRL